MSEPKSEKQTRTEQTRTTLAICISIQQIIIIIMEAVD